MNQRSDLSYARFMVSTIIGLVVASVAHADSTDGAPQLKIGEVKPRSNFYFKVDTGAVFFQPPKKDNANFQEAVNPGPANGVLALGKQPGDDTTWSAGGTVGFYLPVQPTDSWLGKNLRVEASGDYYAPSRTDKSGLSVSPSGNFITVGRLDGNYVGRQSTDIGTTSVSSNPVASETMKTEDTVYQADVAFRSDYLFDYGQVVLSPKLGFAYSHLTQNFHTTASGLRGTVDQQEEINTDYFGPKFALELKVQAMRNLVCFGEAELSPYYAWSDYSGSQTGTSTQFLGGAGHNVATDSQSSFAFKGGLKGGLYYDFGPVILKVGGGFEYWNYVSTIQEASIPNGGNTFNTVITFTTPASHLVSSDMLNPVADMSIIVPF